MPKFRVEAVKTTLSRIVEVYELEAPTKAAAMTTVAHNYNDPDSPTVAKLPTVVKRYDDVVEMFPRSAEEVD